MAEVENPLDPTNTDWVCSGCRYRMPARLVRSMEVRMEAELEEEEDDMVEHLEDHTARDLPPGFFSGKLYFFQWKMKGYYPSVSLRWRNKSNLPELFLLLADFQKKITK